MSGRLGRWRIGWNVMLAFILFTTPLKILLRPLRVNVELDRIEGWLTPPHTRVPHPSDRHNSRYPATWNLLAPAEI